MDVRPLAITQVHWPTFIQACVDTLGYSPTRGLDNIGMRIENGAAYLGSVDLENDVTNHLRGRRGTSHWRHVSASFIFSCKSKTLERIRNNTNLIVTAKRISEDDNLYCCIATGDMSVWRDSIIIGCSEWDKEIRELMNYCLVYLQESGFRELWHDYEKVGLPDKTFIMKRMGA